MYMEIAELRSFLVSGGSGGRLRYGTASVPFSTATPDL
jgi:hypothetical protein